LVFQVQQQIDEKAQEKSAASFGFTHHAQGSEDLGARMLSSKN
jgi:hypothetical protein